jgi:CheY-like chemotaxis protein
MAKSLLVVDDDADLASGLKLFLEAKGFEIKTAGSVQAASALLDAGYKPDLVVSDVMMTEVNDGIVFARELRKREACKKTPIVMLTGMRESIGFFPFKDDPRDPTFLPVDAFFEKPVKRDLLLAKIVELLGATRPT